MRAIVVDDEPIMLKRFARVSTGIPDLCIVSSCRSAREALDYAANHPIELAFLDIEMPEMKGIELAQRLRVLRPDVLIVFISAYDEYIRDTNKIGCDYYIVKPYDRDTLDLMMERIRLLARRQDKTIYIRTFGTFHVMNSGTPVPLTGKAKEILAYLVACRGKEVSNQTIYTVLWENRNYGAVEMQVYYNALKRLKQALESAGLDRLLISTTRGQMLNTDLFDCDYYAWLDKSAQSRDRFEGEFLPEYSWAEPLLADLLTRSV